MEKGREHPKNDGAESLDDLAPEWEDQWEAELQAAESVSNSPTRKEFEESALESPFAAGSKTKLEVPIEAPVQKLEASNTTQSIPPHTTSEQYDTSESAPEPEVQQQRQPTLIEPLSTPPLQSQLHGPITNNSTTSTEVEKHTPTEAEVESAKANDSARANSASALETKNDEAPDTTSSYSRAPDAEAEAELEHTQNDSAAELSEELEPAKATPHSPVREEIENSSLAQTARNLLHEDSSAQWFDELNSEKPAFDTSAQNGEVKSVASTRPSQSAEAQPEAYAAIALDHSQDDLAAQWFEDLAPTEPVWDLAMQNGLKTEPQVAAVAPLEYKAASVAAGPSVDSTKTSTDLAAQWQAALEADDLLLDDEFLPDDEPLLTATGGDTSFLDDDLLPDDEPQPPPKPVNDYRPPLQPIKDAPKAQSFADKSIGGYSSPYDLPADLTRPKKRPVRSAARTEYRSGSVEGSLPTPPATAPPLRSGSLQTPSSTSMYAPPPAPAAVANTHSFSSQSAGNFSLSQKPSLSSMYAPQQPHASGATSRQSSSMYAPQQFPVPAPVRQQTPSNYAPKQLPISSAPKQQTPSIYAPQQTPPAAAPAPPKPQSFITEPASGYSSPYDLPMDLTSTKVRPAKRSYTPTAESAMRPPFVDNSMLSRRMESPYARPPSVEQARLPPRNTTPYARPASVENTPLPPRAADPYMRPASVEGSRLPPRAHFAQPSIPEAPEPMFRARGYSQTREYIMPTDGREHDPLQRWKGGPIFAWGATGTVVTSFPKEVPRYAVGSTAPRIQMSPGEVTLKNMKDVYPIKGPLADFPGPLRGKSKKKEVLGWLSMGIEEFERELSSQMPDDQHFDKRKQERLLLWKLLHAFVQHDGILEGNAEVDKVVRTIMLPANGTLQQQNRPVEPSAGAVADAVNPGAIDAIRDHLLQGDREKAVWTAVDSRLWAHAMLIAYTFSGEVYKQVVQEFVSKEVKEAGQHTQSLAALYEVFAGNHTESIDELVPPSARAGMQMLRVSGGGPSQNAISGLESWQETLALILGNRSTGDNEAIQALGKLLASYDRTEAAHICFIFGRSKAVFSGGDDPKADMVLIGSDHRSASHDFERDLESIQLTEVYEYALMLSGAPSMSAGAPHLTAYKLQLAKFFSSRGLRAKAIEYCDAISSMITSQTKRSPYHNPALLSELDNLAKRLKQSPNDERSSTWLAKPKMDQVSSSVWTKFNKFVAGDDEEEPSVTGGDGAQSGPFGRIAGGTPTISRAPTADIYHPQNQGLGLPDIGSLSISGNGPSYYPQSGSAASSYNPPSQLLPPFSPPYVPQIGDRRGSHGPQPPQYKRRQPTPDHSQRAVSRGSQGSRYAPAPQPDYTREMSASPALRHNARYAPSPGPSLSEEFSRSPEHIQPPQRSYTYDSHSSNTYAPSEPSTYAPVVESQDAPAHNAYPSPYESMNTDSFGAGGRAAFEELPQASFSNASRRQADRSSSADDAEQSAASEGAPAAHSDASHASTQPNTFVGPENAPFAANAHKRTASPMEYGGYAPPEAGTYTPHESGGYTPPTYEPYVPEPEAESSDEAKPKKKSFMDDDDDDDFVAKSKNLKEKTKAEKDREADEAFRKAAEEDGKVYLSSLSNQTNICSQTCRGRKGPEERWLGSWFLVQEEGIS